MRRAAQAVIGALRELWEFVEVMRAEQRRYSERQGR